MTNPTSLGDLVVSPAIDDSRFWADFRRLQQQVEREGVKLNFDSRQALSATDRVKKDLEALGSLTGKQASEQTRAAKVLGAEYQATTRAVQAQNASVLAAYREQKAAAQARTAQLREEGAQAVANQRSAAQATRENQEALGRIILRHAQLRAEFDKQAGEVTTWQKRLQLAREYERGIDGLRDALKRYGERADLTTQQLTQMERVQGRIARERATLNGNVNVLGLSGNVMNGIDNSRLNTLLGVMGNISPSLGAAAMNGSQAAEAFTSLGTAAGGMGIALGVAGVAVAGITTGIAASITASADLEAALNGLKASSGANAQEMKGMRDEAQNVAREYGLMSTQVVKAQEELSKAGVSLKDIASGATEGVTVLAKATGVGIEEAVAIAVPAMNVWGISGAQMMHVADVISNGANKSALDVAGMAQSLQQAAGAANTAGLSFEETTAVLALLADRGMQGSDAGTSLRVMLERLRSPTDDTTEALRKNGVAVFDASGKQRDMVVVLGEIIGAMDKMTDQQRAAFAQTVFGTDAQRAITSAWKEGSATLQDYIKKVSESGTAQANAATRTEGLRGAQAKLNSALDVFKTKVGDVFTPAITELVDAASTGINTLSKLFDWLKQLDDARGKVEKTALQGQLDKARNDLSAAKTELAGLLKIANPSEAGLRRIEAQRATVARLESQIKGLELQVRTEAVQNGTFIGPVRPGQSDRDTPGVRLSAQATSSFGQQVLAAAGPKLGDISADEIVDYCAKWVRLTLNKAAPEAAQQVNKLFQTDSNADGMVTATDAARNLLKAGYARQYSGTKDLQPGDIVFYTENGQNHTGVYIGDGMVRGNNRVTYAQNGGKFDKWGNPISTGINPVGDVAIGRLGTPNWVVRPGEMLTQMGVQPKAKDNTAPGNTTPDPDKLKDYNLTLGDWNKNQARALELAREAAKAETDLTGKRGLEVAAAMRAWAGESKARQAAYQLAVSLVAKQKQAQEQAKRDQEKDEKEAERRTKAAQQQAARINEAARQGNIRAAQAELARLEEMRTSDLRRAGENAAQVSAVERRYAELTYAAKKAIADKEKVDRDAGIKNDPNLNATTRKKALETSETTYQTALRAAGNARQAALDKINKDTEEAARRNAAVMPGLMSGWVTEWANDEQKDRDAAAAGAALTGKLIDGAIAELTANLAAARAELKTALEDATVDLFGKALEVGIDPFNQGTPEQYRDSTPAGRGGLAALISGDVTGFLAAYADVGGAPDDLLDQFKDADWEGLGQDVLRGLSDGLRGQPAWAGVKRVVDDALGKILEDAALQADVTSLVTERDLSVGVPAGLVTGNDRPDGERTPLAEAVAKKAALDAYVESLKDMKEAGLAAAEADALAADNADFYNAVLAERARRLQVDKDKAEAAAKAERELADALARGREEAIAQGIKDAESALAAQQQVSDAQLALDDARGLRQPKYAQEIQALETLKGEHQDLADQIDVVIAGYQRLQEIDGVISAFQEYAGYVQDLAGAFSGLASATGNDDLAANLDGAANLAGKLISLAGDIGRIIANPADIGAWVGAITKVVSAIGEALNGHRKAYEQAAKMREDFNKRFTLLNGDDFAKTTVRSRGWLADTFGGGPEVKQVVDEFGLKIAQAIEGGVMGGIKNGMKQALTTGDWTNFSNTFRESAYSGVVDGLIEAIFNDALKDILAPGIKALTDAAKTPGTEDDAAAIAAFEAGIVAAEQFLTTTGQAIQPSLDRLRNDLGITTPGNTGGVDTTGLSTMPEPVQFALATPLLESGKTYQKAGDTLLSAATRIDEAFKRGLEIRIAGDTKGTGYVSTTGALV